MAPQGGDIEDARRPDTGIGSSHVSEVPARPTRYRMMSGLSTLGTDFYVLSASGEHAFKIDGCSIAEEDLIRVEDLEGHPLYVASAHLAWKQNKLAISNGEGQVVGAIERHQITPLRDRFSIVIDDRRTITVSGNVPTHEYEFLGADSRIAEVSRRWFRARNSYGVEVPPGQQDAFLLACVVLLDQMVSSRT